mmetsp:Transcript_20867/g.32711  ORF Transcript_20867/g.32711 Transcript_20867/m.32711 type:complete len:230 (-) Transcript_20867:805-1494(-)
MNPPHRFLSGTMVNRLVHHLGTSPFVVHRLDMWTSGVLVFAKTKEAVVPMHELFRDRQVRKEYILLSDGCPTPDQAHGEFQVSAGIARDKTRALLRAIDDEKGKPSKTVFKVLATSEDKKFSLLRALPLTGRTHQIRIHAMHAGLPIVGDNVYGREAALYEDDNDLMDSDDNGGPRHFTGEDFRVPLKLHARRLEFTRPDNDQEISIVAPLPEHFTGALHLLGIKDEIE